MAFFGFFNAYTLRGNLSIAIVAMTSDRYDTLTNGTVVNVVSKNVVIIKNNNSFVGFLGTRV